MNEQLERAWQGGPLRRVGTGNGSPSRYHCDECKQSAHTGVRLDARRGKWRCASCETGRARKTPWARAKTGLFGRVAISAGEITPDGLR